MGKGLRLFDTEDQRHNPRSFPWRDRTKGAGEREAQATFSLDELSRAMDEDPRVRERIREYSQRIVGDGVTQTSRAIQETEGLRALLGGSEEGKRLVLQILDGHRQRLDRLGIDPLDD